MRALLRYIMLKISKKSAKWPKLIPTEFFFVPLGCAGAKYSCAESAQNQAFSPSVHFLASKSSPSKQKISNLNVRVARAWSPVARNLLFSLSTEL